jgi:hypothetical protein
MPQRQHSAFEELARRLDGQSYDDYLSSPHWLQFKSRYFEKKARECDLCGDPAVELHHITYRNLGRERLQDVVPLCRFCHEGTHDHARTDRFEYAHRRYRRSFLQRHGFTRKQQRRMREGEKRALMRQLHR